MKKLLAICITAIALAANVTVGCLADENNAQQSENQTEIAQNDRIELQSDKQNADESVKMNNDENRKQPTNEADVQAVTEDSKENSREEREERSRVADSSNTTEDSEEQQKDSSNNLFSLNNIIMFAALLLILIFNIITLILNLLSIKKRDAQINELKSQIKNNSSKSDNNNINGLTTEIISLRNIVKNNDDNIKKVAANVEALKNKMTVQSTSAPAPSKSVERQKTVKIPASTSRKYDDYLKGKGPLPEGLSIIKIGVSGTKPTINNNDGIEFYCEKDNFKYNIYPKKEYLDEDFIPNMGTAIMTFVKSANGVKRLINATTVTIDKTDQTIDVKIKGKAEY